MVFSRQNESIGEVCITGFNIYSTSQASTGIAFINIRASSIQLLENIILLFWPLKTALPLYIPSAVPEL